MPGRFCEQCGAVIEPTARFCASCGTAVAPVPATPPGGPLPGWPAPPNGGPPQVGPAAGWQMPTAPVPSGPTSSGPPGRTRGKGRLVLLAVVVVALVGVALAVGDQAAPGNVAAGQDTAIGGLIGERPIIRPGPDLGDAWTSAPDPATFLLIEDSTPVASDQYLVVFADGTPASTAEAAAQAVGGTIAGHFAYLDTWKIQTAHAATDDSATPCELSATFTAHGLPPRALNAASAVGPAAVAPGAHSAVTIKPPVSSFFASLLSTFMLPGSPVCWRRSY